MKNRIIEKPAMLKVVDVMTYPLLIGYFWQSDFFSNGNPLPSLQQLPKIFMDWLTPGSQPRLCI
jgi:hypothetical protein